jgi:rhodanese-related sulfurtransferase
VNHLPPPTPRSIDDILEEARAGHPRVDPSRAAALVSEGGVLIDIRPAGWRRAKGEIPGAVIIERNVLEWRLDPRSAARLDWVGPDIYDRDVIVVCNEGYASSLAAADLRRLGLRSVTDLEGGFAAWAAAGQPVTAPGANPT